MARGARIKRNSLFAFLSRLIRLLTNFVLFVGIARFYGVEAFGQFTTAHTLSTIFLLFADFGFDSLLPTEIAAHRNSAGEYIRRYFSFKIVFLIVATLAMMSVPWFQDMSDETRTLVNIFSFYVFFASLNSFFFALFRGFEEFQHETWISFITNLLMLVLVVILGILHVSLSLLAVCFVGTRIVGIVMGLKRSAYLAGGPIMSFTFAGWREIWQHVAVFGLNFVFGALYFQLDTILLAFWRGDRDVGIYQAAYKLASLALVVSDIGITTTLPLLARLSNENLSRWSAFGRLLNKTLFLVSLPVSMVMFVFAEQIIAALYGAPEFADAVPLLRLFALIVFVRYGFEAYAIMLTTSRRQSKRMTIVVIGTVFNLALNIVFIPMYGPYGAAIVSLATNIVIGASFVLASGQPFLAWTFERRNMASLAVTALLVSLGWMFRFAPFWFLIPVVFSLSITASFFLGYSREERRLVFARRPIG